MRSSRICVGKKEAEITGRNKGEVRQTVHRGADQARALEIGVNGFPSESYPSDQRRIILINRSYWAFGTLSLRRR